MVYIGLLRVLKICQLFVKIIIDKMYIIVGVRAGAERGPCRPVVPLSFVVGIGVPGSCS
jgi:hypothetical protein